MAKMAIPTNQAELRELLSDTAKTGELTASGQLPEAIEAYTAMVNKKDPDLKAEMTQQMQAIAQEFYAKNSPGRAGSLSVKPGQGKDTTVFNAKAPGATVEKEFKGVADFFQSIWHNARYSPELNAKLDRVKNAASSYDGASGGYLIPESIRSEILQLSLEDGVVRPRATVLPMSTPRLLIPSVDETSHVSSVFGGITAYWESEAQSHTNVNASFARKTLDSHKLTAYTEVPNELLADGVAFEAFLGKSFPQALSFYEDLAFMSGSGVGQPEGFYNADAGVVVTKESGQAADTIVWENIVKMYSRMLPGSLNKAVWVVPPNAFPELATMALSVGTGGSAIWLNNGQVGPPMTILGRPVIVTEKAPTLGDEGDITFIDMSYYLVGDHQMMTATSSPHYKFQTDETAFKVISRVDGRVWLNSALTPNNGGSTLSPVVKLGARA